jgi:hypothetical protein
MRHAETRVDWPLQLAYAGGVLIAASVVRLAWVTCNSEWLIQSDPNAFPVTVAAALTAWVLLGRLGPRPWASVFRWTLEVTALFAITSGWNIGETADAFSKAGGIAIVGWVWARRLGPVPWAPVVRGTFAVAALLLEVSCVATAKFVDTKLASYRTAMMSDLRNLMLAEEQQFRRSRAYTADLPAGFERTTGVGSPRIALTADGWTARVDHSGTAWACAIYVGSTPIPPARIEAEPACQGPPPETAAMLGPLGVVAAGFLMIVAGLLRSAFIARRSPLAVPE